MTEERQSGGRATRPPTTPPHGASVRPPSSPPLIVLPPLALFLAAAVWFLWLVARDGTGSATGAALALGGVAAVAAILKRQGVVRNFTGGLMMIAWAGFAGLVWFVCGFVVWAFVVG
jgi:hypothetical protein